jgi:hypothetical protein
VECKSVCLSLISNTYTQIKLQFRFQTTNSIYDMKKIVVIDRLGCYLSEKLMNMIQRVLREPIVFFCR